MCCSSFLLAMIICSYMPLISMEYVDLIQFEQCLNKFVKIPIPLQEFPTATLFEDYAERSPEEMRKMYEAECAREDTQAQNKKIPAKSDTIVRIMTFNIYMGQLPVDRKSNFSALENVIASCAPDILILQEVHSNNLGITKQMLQARAYSVIIEQIAEGFLYNVIALKPTVATQVVVQKEHFKDEQRSYIKLQCSLQGTPISIYGTHLDVYDKTEKTREAEIKELLAYAQEDIKLGRQVIIAGDMNAIDPEDYQYRNKKGELVWNLVQKNYKKHRGHNPATLVTDAIRANHFIDCFAKGNFVPPRWTCWTGTRVDRIYLSPNWTIPIKGCYVHFSATSDHIPVIMDLDFSKVAHGAT